MIILQRVAMAVNPATPATRRTTSEAAVEKIAGARVMASISSTLPTSNLNTSTGYGGTWLHCGVFNLLAGQSTAGKSTIALSFCATSTRGGFWPDGQPCQPGHAIYWSGEDGIKDTLLPRFMAAGGDRARMHFISGIREGERKRSFNPAVDMPALQSTVETLKNVNLIVLDPVAVVVKGDSHKNVETRVGMQPFSDMCLQCGACGLGIHHLTKNTKGRTLLERVSGSLAFHAAPRAVLMAMEHQTDRGRRVVVRAKVSNGPVERRARISLRCQSQAAG